MRSVDLVSAPLDLVSVPAAQQLVSVILPVFNEGDQLAMAVASVREALERDLPACAHEIVIVDDASTDRSSLVGKYLAQVSRGIRYVRCERNGGVDAAVRIGVASANGNVLVVLDADLSYSPSIVRDLIDPVLSGSADVALASPYVKGGAVRNVPTTRALLSRWANKYLAYASRSRAHTFTCIVRAYSGQAARDLYESFDDKKKPASVHRVLFEAIRRGYKIQEIPATLEWPENRTSRMRLLATVQRTLDVLWSGLHFRLGLISPIPLPKRRIANYS